MRICYSSKYLFFNLWVFATIVNTHRTLQGAFVAIITDIRFFSTLSKLLVSFLNYIFASIVLAFSCIENTDYSLHSP